MFLIGEINRRIDVINEHLDGVINEKLLVVEAETVCLQFRKILEMEKCPFYGHFKESVSTHGQ